MINESDLEELYLSHATHEFQNILEHHSDIEFYTDEEIAKIRDSFQSSAIEENNSRSFDEI